jgi:hypothetical protein
VATGTWGSQVEAGPTKGSVIERLFVTHRGGSTWGDKKRSADGAGHVPHLGGLLHIEDRSGRADPLGRRRQRNDMKTAVPIFRGSRRFVAISFTAVILLSSVMSSVSARFYGDDPIWAEVNSQDASRVKFYEPQLIYDVAENMFARPGDKDFNRRAQNINTVDEVPDGSWFTNRADRRTLTPQEVARGSNTSSDPSAGKWTIIAAKTDGVSPGFTIRDSSGLEPIWLC